MGKQNLDEFDLGTVLHGIMLPRKASEGQSARSRSRRLNRRSRLRQLVHFAGERDGSTQHYQQGCSRTFCEFRWRRSRRSCNITPVRTSVWLFTTRRGSGLERRNADENLRTIFSGCLQVPFSGLARRGFILPEHVQSRLECFPRRGVCLAHAE